MIRKSNLEVRVNGDTIAIVPKTFKYNKGLPEITVVSASLGGGNTTEVHSENVETSVGMVSFSIYPSDEILTKMKVWKSNIEANTVSGIDKNGKPVTMIKASMTNNPDIEPTTDGTVEIIFMGSRI